MAYPSLPIWQGTADENDSAVISSPKRPRVPRHLKHMLVYGYRFPKARWVSGPPGCGVGGFGNTFERFELREQM